MKKIALSQQVQHHPEYSCQLDALDSAWTELVFSLGFLPVVLPNLKDETNMSKLFQSLDVDGFILTGGNDLARTKSPRACLKRDQFENAIISHALQHNLPVLGVCRGMQLLNCYFGGGLVKTPHQVAHKQSVRLKDGSLRWVNSYHQWGVNGDVLAPDMQVLAESEDKTIKSIKHISHAVTGIMWHPERQHSDKEFSFNLIKDLFK